MKALVYTAPHTMTYMDYADPELHPDETLIQIHASGICGSDMHAWHGHDSRRQPPLVLGHEVAGVALSGPFKGQRVTLNPLIRCSQCELCLAGKDNLCQNRTMIGMTRPGGYAEQVSIPNDCVVPIGDTIPFTIASLTEPAAVCLHAVKLAKKLPNLRDLKDQNCLIIGAGAIGILTALVLRQFGVQRITISETNAQRCQTAELSTQATVINPLTDAVPEQSFHCVFDAVGSDMTRQVSTQSVHDCGSIIHIGLQTASGPMDARRITLGEIIFAGVYTYTMNEFKDALAMLKQPSFSDYQWLTTAPLSEGASCFEAIDAGTTQSAKIVLTSNQ